MSSATRAKATALSSHGLGDLLRDLRLGVIVLDSNCRLPPVRLSRVEMRRLGVKDNPGAKVMRPIRRHEWTGQLLSAGATLLRPPPTEG